MYQFVICYPLAAFPGLDDPIRRLAARYDCAELGSGAGSGQRDLVFEFQALDEQTTLFLKQVLTLSEVEVTISAIVADTPLPNS